MNLQEIKNAVNAGRTVHWKSEIYDVIKDQIGQWLIRCKQNQNYTGLTHKDEVTMNGNEEDFYVAPLKVLKLTIYDNLMHDSIIKIPVIVTDSTQFKEWIWYQKVIDIAGNEHWVQKDNIEEFRDTHSIDNFANFLKPQQTSCQNQ